MPDNASDTPPPAANPLVVNAIAAFPWVTCNEPIEVGVLLHRFRVIARHVELEGFVLGMPALCALDAHPDDYRDVIVHASQCAASATVA